jgi:hypothetical protein
LFLAISSFHVFELPVQLDFNSNPRAADAIHQAAKADRHCSEGIARTGCGLDQQEELAEHQ